MTEYEDVIRMYYQEWYKNVWSNPTYKDAFEAGWLGALEHYKQNQGNNNG